jgi:hypothetical protein
MRTCRIRAERPDAERPDAGRVAEAPAEELARTVPAGAALAVTRPADGVRRGR